MSDERLKPDEAFHRKAIVEAMARAAYAENPVLFPDGSPRPWEDEHASGARYDLMRDMQAALTALSLALEAQGFACPTDRCPYVTLLKRGRD